MGYRVPGEAGRLGAGHGGHADAGRDVHRRTGHHRLEGSSGRGVFRGSPHPGGRPGRYLGPASVTAHLVGVAGGVGNFRRVGPAVAAALAQPVPRAVTEPGPVPAVPESDPGTQPVAHPDALPVPISVADSEPDPVAISVSLPDPDPHPNLDPDPDPDPHPNLDPDSHPDPDRVFLPDGEPEPVADPDRVRDGHAVPGNYPIAMTAWVIAETGALVAAPTAALTLGVAGARACLGAITRARGRQRRSPVAQTRQRAGPPVLLLAAPVATATAELVPPTAELVPPTAELVPLAAELVPPTAELVPPTAELVPPTAELVPVAAGAATQAHPGRPRTSRPRTSRTRTWGGLPAVFWRLVITLVPGRGLACLYLTLAYYAARERHLDASQVAVVLAAFGVGWAAGPPIAGWAADRIGPRKVIIAGNVAAWAAYTVAGMARSAAALAAGAAAVGLVFEMWRPAAQSMLATAAEDDIQRKRCMTLLTWIINVLLTVATLAGGALAAYAGWGWLFVASATGAAAFAALAWLLLPRDRPRRPARPRHRGSLVGDPLLWAFTALTLLILTAGQQSVYALPVRFAGTGIGPLGYGLIAAMNPLTVAVLQPLAQGWLVRLPAVPLCAAGMALIGIGIAVTGAGTGLAWYAGTSVIWTLGEIAAAGLAPAIVASIAPPGRAGAYLGTWGSALGLSTLTAAVAGDTVIGAGGLPLLWACCAATGVVAGVACACLARPVAARRHGQAPVLGAGQAGPAPSASDQLATG